MAFVKQVGESCGAFCLAYYQWLKEGRKSEDIIPPDQEEKDINRALDIYTKIKFGSNYTEVINPDYSNPLKMLYNLGILRGNNEAEVYFNESIPIIKQIFNLINNDENDKSMYLSYNNKIKNINSEPMPTLQPNQYAIAVVICGGGLHWLLIHNEGGTLVVYDPNFGTKEKIGGDPTPASLNTRTEIKGMPSLKTFIYLP